MKRISLFVLLPVLLCALEKVNLIRNSSFERDDSVWVIEKGAYQEPNPAEGMVQDGSEYVTGLFSSSSDTREEPTWKESFTGDSVVIKQDLIGSKRFDDFDSLCWNQLILPLNSMAQSSNACLVGLSYTNASPTNNGLGYGFIHPDGAGVDWWIDLSEHITNDETWIDYRKSLQDDFPGVEPQQEIVSFVLVNWGIWFGLTEWRGQKVYWDDIRLMGWADYNIALTRLTGTLSQPAAMVWNNGREDQTDVVVIATIEGGEPYADTVILPSLATDDSTEVTFTEFGPITPSGNYTLTIVTGNFAGMLDECDEDDMLTEEYVGVTDQSLHEELSLIVQSLTSPLHVSYSLPQGEHGNLTLFDATGRRIERLTVHGPGNVNLGEAQPAGVYIVRLEVGGEVMTKKAVVVR